MGSRYRRQEELRIDISGGDWLLVRKHLTAGEARSIAARAFKPGTFKAGGQPEVDIENFGIGQAVGYLIDWSITDVDDKPISIRGKGYEFVEAALKNQSPESLTEILDAIQAHDAAMTAERELQKKVQAGTIAPSPISTSAA
jgi:hypothetical protein